MNTNIIKESYRGYQAVSLPDELFSRRVIFFTAEVTPQSVETLIAQLLQLECTAPGEPITLLINSPGGDVNSGLAAIDTMAGITSPVNTVCLGFAASMGALLFLQGEERIMLPHAKLMIHDPSFSGAMPAGAKPLSIKEDLDRLMHTRTELAEIIADRTGNDIEAVYAKTKDDCYMTAQEALDFGAATAIRCFTLNHD